MWKWSLLSSGASVWVKERKRERKRKKKSAASAVWLQSIRREGGEGLVQHSSSKLRDCGGGQKGTCWPRIQVSFIHSRAHTHIRTQDEQQPFDSIRLAFATFYEFWVALSTFDVNYYFVICCKQTLSLKWLNAFLHEAMAIPKAAFVWYNYSDLDKFKFTDARHKIFSLIYDSGSQSEVCQA